MKAAVVTAAGALPVCADFPEPAAAEGQITLRVIASALSQLTRARAADTHYSSADSFPLVAGVDGVGLLPDGTPAYFVFPAPPQGAMAQVVAVRAPQVVPLPAGLDPVTAAALVNPAMSSWIALTERAAFAPGETVLINGATGASGRLAVQVARHLGAGRIIATGRNPAALQALGALGADQVISLAQPEAALQADLAGAFAEGIDVVLDYLWGAPAGAVLSAMGAAPDPARPIRFVQIGSMAGDSLPLPAAALRSRALVLMGSGLGSVAPMAMMGAIRALIAAAPAAGLTIATETAPLSEVTEAWVRPEGGARLVVMLSPNTAG